MFKKMLFATNASPACDAAAKVAFELAEKYKSELILFHVFGEPSHGGGTDVKDYVTGETETAGPDYVEFVKDEVKVRHETLIEKHGEPRLETLAGIPSTEILRFARNLAETQFPMIISSDTSILPGLSLLILFTVIKSSSSIHTLISGSDM